MSKSFISAYVLVYTHPLGNSNKFDVVNIKSDYIECWRGNYWKNFQFSDYPYLEVVALVNGQRVKTWLQDLRPRDLTEAEQQELDAPIDPEFAWQALPGGQV